MSSDDDDETDDIWAPKGTLDAGVYHKLQESAVNDSVPLLEEALGAGINVNALLGDESSGDGSTALHIAAKKGNINVLKRLIEHGANVNVRDRDGTNQFDDATPLYVAAESAQAEAVNVLLMAGANTRMVGPGDDAPFGAVLARHIRHANLDGTLEVEDRHFDTINAFIAHGVDINDRANFNGPTVTEQAALLGNQSLIHLLLNHGASKKGLLDSSIHSYTNIETVKYLIDQGARDDDGQALYQASKHNQQETAAYLLSHAESPTSIEKSAALHAAAFAGHSEMVRFLLAHGFSPNARDAHGRTPLIRTCAGNDTRFDVMQMLLDHGADINARTTHDEATLPATGDTALHAAAAAWQPHPEIFSFLLRAGADVHARNAAGQTPLMAACRLNGPEAAWDGSNMKLRSFEMLVEAGSELDAVDDRGESALMVLARIDTYDSNGNVRSGMRLLVGKGADVELRNGNGETAAGLYMGRDPQVVQLLKA